MIRRLMEKPEATPVKEDLRLPCPSTMVIVFRVRHANQIIFDLDFQADPCGDSRSSQEKLEMSSTNYPANAVACKLWGLVGSPTEFILGLAVYHAFARSYEAWTPWLYSNEEYRQAVAEGGPFQILFALCPNYRSIKSAT